MNATLSQSTSVKLASPQSRQKWSSAQVFQRVPDEDIRLLDQLADLSSRSYWMVGDIANKWIEIGIPAMSAYSAIGERFGKRTTSIRTYAYLARKFTPATREEYGILTFDHFRYAYMCDNPRQVLDYAVQVADERGGRPASVDELRATFRGARRIEIDDEPEPPQPVYTHPGWAIPIVRRISLLAEEAREEANTLLESLISYIKEQEVTNEKVNNNLEEQ